MPSPKVESMLFEHTKDFDGWNKLKKKLSSAVMTTRYFHSREVWFCSLGHNVGFEEDGKGIAYSRPIIVVRRCGPAMFIGIPITSKIKHLPYYFVVGMVHGKEAAALLSQIRVFSSKRLIRQIDTLPEDIFKALKNAARKYIF